MVAIHFNPSKKELCIRLHHHADTESRRFFLWLGHFLQPLGEKRLACLGTKIIAAVSNEPPHPTSSHESNGCIFCDIAKKNHTAKSDGTACVL
jgi:hypothetical protein